LILLCIALAIISMIVSPPNSISAHWLFYINPFSRVSDFIIGMLFCRLFLISNYEPTTKICGLIESLSILSFFLTAYIATNYIADMNVKYDLLFIPCMLFIVVAFSFNKGFISKFLSKKAFILLGEASFSFYMIHYMFVVKLNYMLLPSPNSPKELIYYITLAFAGALLSSIAIFKLIELPVNKFIRKSWLSFRYQKQTDQENQIPSKN
jgi:peptidoglycan/LPS O-acetylase OafA/YrhL